MSGSNKLTLAGINGQSRNGDHRQILRRVGPPVCSIGAGQFEDAEVRRGIQVARDRVESHTVDWLIADRCAGTFKTYPRSRAGCRIVGDREDVARLRKLSRVTDASVVT